MDSVIYSWMFSEKRDLSSGKKEKKKSLSPLLGGIHEQRQLIFDIFGTPLLLYNRLGEEGGSNNSKNESTSFMDGP